MRAALWMAIGSLAVTLAVIGIAGRQWARDVAFGVLAPLAAASVSWVLTERIYSRDPERLTGVMVAGFAAKMVFFGAYVALMLKVVGVRPVPFVASFTGFFIGLYAVEALLMRRLFAGR
jgi:hypothetical protein